MDVREKGYRWERAVVKNIKEVGEKFRRAITTRANNKILDSCKVDIDRIPLYIQCKSGYLRGINYSKLISEMVTLIRKEFGSVDYPIVVMHKKSSKYEENLVIIPYKDFMHILKQAHSEQVNKNADTR